ncbi:MAG: hypothetical protein AB7O66_13195 [Limisphaerales bacterium]
MTPALSQPNLADHALIRECLKAHGFEPIGRSRFSNGRATVDFEGTRLVAVPGDGSRNWRSEVGAVPAEAIVALLNGFLATPPFLSQQEIDHRLARTHAAKIALDRIVEVIREAPDAAPSRELRRFLWSLFNGHHLINLWRLRHTLDHQQSGLATEVFTAWMNGHVPDELLRHALTDRGEMEPRNGMPRTREQQQG